MHRLTITILLWAAAAGASAQLAITEVMSESAINAGLPFKGPDYWELTNFGTNDLALDGYSFSDDRKTNSLVRYPFTNLVIRAGETIVFFRSQPNRSVTNAAQFRAWWGETNVAEDLKLRRYESPGFDGDFGDHVWVYDPQLRPVDGVQFGQARVGRSFTYDPGSGIFGVTSVTGLYASFCAVLAEDMGSPGTNTGPVALRLLRPPASQIVDAGDAVTFAVEAVGLPRPRYQWLARGVPIPGAHESSCTLPIVELSDAGEYSVLVTNGISEILSEPASLTVSTNPAAPEMLRAPVDIDVFLWQTATFSALARGYPPPQYQWACNGIDIADATGRTLKVPDVNSDLSGNVYSVRIWNEYGTIDASARLAVVRRPLLRFTEIMPFPRHAPYTTHYDWFELTNGDTNAVDLQGYRFFDTPTLAGGFTISQSLVLQPGESAVFVEHMTREDFLAWWGPERVPPNLQVHTYHGFALGNYGEALFLWNAAATDPFDTVATASWAAATEGVTLRCVNYCETYEQFGCIGECLTDSVAGQEGSFRAADDADIGSPGWLANPPPRILELVMDPVGITLKCRVTEGRLHRLLTTSSLIQPEWKEVSLCPAESSILWFQEIVPEPRVARFYKLEEVQ